MKQQKGFSLIEVLVSLMLVTVIALSLVQQQWQSRQVLTQLTLRAQNLCFLSQLDEAKIIHMKRRGR
jgi:prepilin-type N-terminal cleavage/methylation domain-containing protein